MKSKTKIIYPTTILVSLLAFFTLLSLSFTAKENTVTDTELMTVVVKYKGIFKYGHGQRIIISHPNQETIIRYLISNSSSLSPRESKRLNNLDHKLGNMKTQFDNSMLLKELEILRAEGWRIKDHNFSVAKSASDADGSLQVNESEFISYYILSRDKQ